MFVLSFFWSEGRGLHIWSALFTAKRQARDSDIHEWPRTVLDKESGIGLRDVDYTLFSASTAGNVGPISAALILRGGASLFLTWCWFQSHQLCMVTKHTAAARTPRTRHTETWAVRVTKHSGAREVPKANLCVRSPETRWNRDSPLSLPCDVSKEELPHVGASCFYASHGWEA